MLKCSQEKMLSQKEVDDKAMYGSWMNYGFYRNDRCTEVYLTTLGSSVSKMIDSFIFARCSC